MAPIILFIYFIFLKIFISCNATAASTTFYTNETQHELPRRSDRVKRALFDIYPKTLKLNFKPPEGDVIQLKWTKRESYLANSNLPVIRSSMYFIGNKNVMNDIGEFIVYHDSEHNSAVVFFGNLNTFHGVIGTDYFIRDLPYNFNNENTYRVAEIGEPYIVKHNYPFAHIHPNSVLPPPSDLQSWEDLFQPRKSDSSSTNLPHSGESSKNQIDPQPGPSHKRTWAEQEADEQNEEIDTKSKSSNKKNKNSVWVPYHSRSFFLETLVFVTNDIVDIFKGSFGNDYFTWIVRYYIIYFNSIDMVLFNINSPTQIKLRMNIAKIVIEDSDHPFDFMKHDDLQFKRIIPNLQQYLSTYKARFTPDSFDYVFISTSRLIWDDSVSVDGLTHYGKNLYEARKNDHFYDVVPISIVRFKFFYSDYLTAAHEIGLTISIKIDPGYKGSCAEGQCYGVMQREGSKCSKCLKWSIESQQDFEKFISENPNRCFLINKPRSLNRAGPMRLISPNVLCKCLGYRSHVVNKGPPVDKVRMDSCGIPMQCLNMNDENYEYIVKPFDGTPCGQTMVCWDNECRRVRSTPSLII